MRTRAEEIANRFLVAFTMLLLSFLTFMAFFWSQRYGIEALGEIINGAPIYQVRDNILLHLAGIAFVALMWAFCTGVERVAGKNVKWIVLLQALLSIGAGVAAWLVLTGGTRTPQDDQIQIYGAASLFNQGNYLNLIKGGYVNMYPQQLGMIAYIQMVLRVWGSVDFYPVQLLNCFWIFGTVFALCLCLDEMAERLAVRMVGSILLSAQLPLILLVSWVYGDLPSFCCCAVATWLYLRSIKEKTKGTRKTVRSVALVFCLCLAVLLRKNSWILVLALVIGLLFHHFGQRGKNRSAGLRRLALIVVCLILPKLCTYALETYYERVSGYEIDGGLPTIMWIAMGVSEDASKPGWFGNFSVPAYYSVDCDREAAGELAWERITQRLELFQSDPVYCISFYKRKICTQWNDPYYCTQSLIGTDSESSGVSAWLEEEQYGALFNYLSVFQFLVYGGALSYAIFEARKRRVCDNLCLIYFAGGFLFSLLWEANSRYVLPYETFLIPIAAIGWDAIFRKISRRKA